MTEPRLRGPRPLPFVGHRWNVLRFFRDPVAWLLRMHREFGDVAAFVDGDPRMVCAFGAEHNRTVLADPERFPNNERMLFPVARDSAIVRLNTALPMQNGEVHRRQRRLMMPAFHKQLVERHASTIVELAEPALAAWQTGECRDANADLLELTLRIAVRCLFGLAVGDEAAELGRLSTSHLEGLTSIGGMRLPLRVPGSPFARLARTSERLEARIRGLIRARVAEGATGDDVLSLLVRAHDDRDGRLDEDELVGQASTLLIAGHETTAYTLVWTLCLLALHPRIMRDVAEEARGATVTADGVRRLDLLGRVVRESMRLLPAVPLLFVRNTRGEVRLGEHLLPGGASIVLSPLVTHRNEVLYPEPDRFDPDRWRTLRPATYEYIPFGAGPRTCIGAGFAQLVIPLVLVLILQRWQIELAPGAVISRKVRGITLGPRHGLPIVLRPHGARIEPRTPRGDLRELVRCP